MTGSARGTRTAATRQDWVWLAVVLPVAAGLATLVASVAGRASVEILGTLLLGAVIVGCAVLAARRYRDLLHPVVILCAVGVLYYVAKPFYLVASGRVNSGAPVDAVAFEGALRESFGPTLALIALFYVLLCGGALLTGGRASPVDLTPVAVGPARERAAWRRYVAFTLVAAVPGVLAIGVLVSQSGGVMAYFTGLSVRSSFLEGRTYLTYAYWPIKIAALYGLWLLASRSIRGSGGRRAFIGAVFAIALLGDLATGGRASLIIGTALPALMIWHYARRRFRTSELALAGVAALAGLLVLGAVGRDAVFNQGRHAGVGGYIAERFQSLGDSLLGGLEAVPFDSLLRLVSARGTGELEYLGGETYESIPAWLVPRQLWADKPFGGGNAWFTETYYPRFYGQDRVQTSISLIGEAFANFGVVGVAVAGILVGLVLGRLYRWMRGGLPGPYLVVYSVVVGYSVSLLRGDAFQNVAASMAMGAVGMVCVWLMSSHGRPGPTPSLGGRGAAALPAR